MSEREGVAEAVVEEMGQVREKRGERGIGEGGCRRGGGEGCACNARLPTWGQCCATLLSVHTATITVTSTHNTHASKESNYGWTVAGQTNTHVPITRNTKVD